VAAGLANAREADVTQPTDSRPQPKEIAGRYEVLLKLGAGAFGTVYKARDKVLGRMVAIKTIRLDGMAASAASLEELLARFRREAQVSAQLKHPNIVTIYDIGEADGLSYLAMEFIDGQGLDKVISAAGRLPPERAAAIAAQIADALDYAHRNNVVHRDVKPANVMIEAGDRVKVTDFGIAKAIDSGEHLTVTGSLLGTPSYMSPEQARGASVDGRSDIFSVGCILYEMLTGKKAFVGDSITALIFKIITEEPPSLKTIDPSIPEPMVRIIMRALSKAPETRHASAQELARELLALASPAAVPTLRQGVAPTVAMPAVDATRVSARKPSVSTHVSPTTHAAPRRPIAQSRPQPGRSHAGIIVGVAVVLVVLVVAVGAAAWWAISRYQAQRGDGVAALQTDASPSPTADIESSPEPETTMTPEASLDWAGEGIEPTPEAAVVASGAISPTTSTPGQASTPPTSVAAPTPRQPPATPPATQEVEQGSGDEELGTDLSAARRALGGAASPALERGLANLSRAAGHRSEKAALQTLGRFIAAEKVFHGRYGRYGTPTELRTHMQLDVTGSTRDSFMRRGYRFKVKVGPNAYSVTATPMRRGLRRFFADQSGEIRPLD
jgi:serine/threonine protein kinase